MSSDLPNATGHALDRWIQHVEEFDTTDPELAWRDGLTLADHGLHAEEARYIPEHDVILCRKQGDLTTVIANDEGLRGEAREAIRVACFLAGERESL